MSFEKIAYGPGGTRRAAKQTMFGAAAIAVLVVGCSGRNSDTESSRAALNANPQTTNFAVYAQNSVALRDRVGITGGDVGVRLAGTAPFVGGSYELILSSQAHVDTGRNVIGKRVQLWDRAQVGDVQTTQLIQQNAIVAHQYPFPSTMPALPPLAQVTPGTVALTVNLASTLIASPGNHGAVTVGDRGVLRLKGGVYHMASLQIGNDARIEALAPVQLRVAGRFNALDRAFIGAAAGVTLTAGDIRIEVSGKNGSSGGLSESPKAAWFGNDDKVNAVMLVPNGTLQTGQRSIVVGAYLAREIYVDLDSTVTFQSGVGPSGCLQSCDDGNPCTVDTCSVGACVHTNSVAGTSCGDGNACNGAEKCDGAGRCQTGTPVQCVAQDQCHTAGTCDPATGACSNPAKVDGTSCADGNACTQTDTCQAGVCVGANLVTCTASDQCHVAGTCDPRTGACSNPAKADGTTCTDGNSCTQTDTCQAGACVGANPVTCTASDQCHVAGTCDPTTGVCSNPAQPNGVVCNDGNACTQTDACVAGACVGTNPVICTAADQCHVVGTCDPASGICSNPAKPNGTVCNDGNACTSGDACSNGVCVATPYSCDDGLGCTADSCNGNGTCNHVIAAGSCVIGNACYANGASNPSSSCQVCNSATATAWTNQADGTSCTDNACSADGGVTDGGTTDGGMCINHTTCIAGSCAGVCVPGQVQCNGQTPQTCDATGNWQGSTACVNQACVAGVCQGICSPGAVRCNGQTPQTCSAVGDWQNGPACVSQTCVSGTCQGECAQGQQRCNGQAPQTCDPAGHWQTGPACQDQACVDGACLGSCSPGSKQCSGYTPQTCDASGTWQNGQDCFPTQTCGGGGVPGECSPACTNLCLQEVRCSTPDLTTTISGKVYAPNGVDPLMNAVVYIPNSPVQSFTAGVTCDACGPAVTGDPLVLATTAADGSFVIKNAPVGTNIPVVIQIGRWRRQITMPLVQACQDNPLAASQTRLPRNKTEGDIPQMAVVTGSVDAVECVLRKIGVADSEFSNPAGTGRVHFYRGDIASGALINNVSPLESALWGNQTVLNRYDAVFFGCEGAATTRSAADKQRLVNFVNAGGRMYLSHYGYMWLHDFAPFSSTASWAVDGAAPYPDPQTGYINMSFPKGLALAQWLQTIGASTTLGQMTINTLRHDFTAVSPTSQLWMTASPSNIAGPVPMHFTFDTPVGATPASQCGRVAFSDFHIENASSTLNMNFPTECSAGAMTPQEKMLEFMIFDLTSCLSNH